MTELFETAFDEMAAKSWQQGIPEVVETSEVVSGQDDTAKAIGHLCMHCDERYLYS